MLAAAGLALAATGADAQPYPSKPITIVVPFAAGSGTDSIARIIGQYLQNALNQSVVIENKVGASGVLAATYVARAAPDGYTLLMATNSTHSANPYLFKSLAYDPVKDFAPVARAGSYVFMLVVNPAVPARTLPELVAYAKANPGKLNFGFGLGTLPQILGESFKAVTGTDIASIPYKGGAQAITDTLGGRIQMNFGTTATLLPLIQQGKVRALAVTTRTRSKDLPDVPTMVESGLPELALIFSAGLLAPAGTPADIIHKLNVETNEAMRTPELTASMAKLGFEPQLWSTQDYAAFLADEMRRWPPIVKAAGVKPE
jgi:tripartite-type tricarboxylate transporter receptor subunit TctC